MAGRCALGAFQIVPGNMNIPPRAIKVVVRPKYINCLRDQDIVSYLLNDFRSKKQVCRKLEIYVFEKYVFDYTVGQYERIVCRIRCQRYLCIIIIIIWCLYIYIAPSPDGSRRFTCEVLVIKYKRKHYEITKIITKYCNIRLPHQCSKLTIW